MPSEAPTPEPRADHDPQHAQPVPERVDLRLARGARLLQGWDLGELEAAALGLDEELDDVLEARRGDGDRPDDVAAYRHVEEQGVGELDAVELPEGPGEHLVPDVADEGVVLAARLGQVARAQGEIRAVLHALHEVADVVEVVGAVGVGEHDDVAADVLEAGDDGRAVAASLLLDDAVTQAPHDLRGAVGGGPVDDEDLVDDIARDLPEHRLDGARLVERRDDEGDRHLSASTFRLISNPCSLSMWGT